MDTENLWKVSAYMPPGLSKFVGEDDVLGPGIDSGRGPIAWMWKQNLDGHRDLGVSAVCNYTPVAGVARRGHSLQCFIMPDHTHHAFSGDQVRRSYSLHNDLFVPSDFAFQWDLLDPSGNVVGTRRADRRRMPSGGLRARASSRLPRRRSDRRSPFTLRDAAPGRRRALSTASGGSWTFGRGPATPIAAPRAKHRALRPGRRHRRRVPQGGPRLHAIGELSRARRRPGRHRPGYRRGRLAGRHGGARGKARRLCGRRRPDRRAGPRPRLLGGLPVRTALEPREWVSMPFVRTPQHPVLSGVTSWDLHFWNPDHVSARGAYSKPDGGPFVTLVDSGTETGLEWVQMMECYRGRGFYLLNQFPVVGRYDVEPMAGELLDRLMAYAAGEKPFRSARRPAPGVGRARFCGRVEAAQTGRVAERGRRRSAADGSVDPAVGRRAAAGRLSAARPLAAGPRRRGHARSSTAPARNIARGFRPWQASRSRWRRNPSARGKAGLVATACTWLTPGLSQIDLYWKRYDGSEGGGSPGRRPVAED